MNYAELFDRLDALCADEDDAIALMATIACEWYHAMPDHHWVGFYRVVAPDLLKIGPYQGGHGCLTIPFARGICGRCARLRETLIIDDVHADPDHIACSSSTWSELVAPIINRAGELIAVFDIDSDLPAAFGPDDGAAVEQLGRYFG